MKKDKHKAVDASGDSARIKTEGETAVIMRQRHLDSTAVFFARLSKGDEK